MNANELKDYYGLLGIAKNATVSDIHKAYWQRASRSHPDKGGSHEQMVQVVEAWKILSDPAKRARYDQLLASRHDGWQSRQFNADVQEARTRARADAGRSWAEFEEIYQKAFYIFNQDFYGEEINGSAAGPYSPLFKPRRTPATGPPPTLRSRYPDAGGALPAYLFKIAILIVAIVTALFLYRTYSGVGRYIPLGTQVPGTVLMLDTTTGAVYAVEKVGGTLSGPWKETVPPVPRKHHWSDTLLHR